MTEKYCTPSNCTVSTGSMTNGTLYVVSYDPTAPVPKWHHNMELATICVCNSLSLLIIVARICYRWRKLKRLKRDDICIAIGGIFILPYTAGQIGTNVWGGGLHMFNVPDSWLRLHWHYLRGWAGYYIIMSLIKLSACLCFVEILPHHLKAMRYCTYVLCALIVGLGGTMALVWLFQCKPFLSNFLWSIIPLTCVNYDYLRWLWVALSIPIDLVLLSIPWVLLRESELKPHERRILKWVFSATLLGTMTCILGIYGVWENRTSVQIDSYYQQTIFIMLNDIEILMYTVGVSFPVLSRYLVSRSTSRRKHTSEPSDTNFSSWARHIPDLFRSATTSPLSRHAQSMAQTNTASINHGEEPLYQASEWSAESRLAVQKSEGFGVPEKRFFGREKRVDPEEGRADELV